MRSTLFLTAVFAAFSLAAAPPPTIEGAWKASLVEANRDWAQVPHAILKIQDSAYLHDGESAVLQGQKGKPGSFHWNHDPNAKGFLTVSVKDGKAIAMKNGKPVDDAALEKSVPIDTDIDVAGHPTQVSANVMGWRLFVYNQQNPDAKNFKGVDFFPYDPAYRIAAKFAPDAKLPPRVFRTSRGTDKQFYHAGDATFMLQGKSVTLPFYADSNDAAKITSMSAFFTDDLTGKEAYGSGRYVDVSDFGKFPPASVTIDFNDAYNPNCARSKHFTCPVAVDNIQLAMKAGEKNPHMAH